MTQGIREDLGSLEQQSINVGRQLGANSCLTYVILLQKAFSESHVWGPRTQLIQVKPRSLVLERTFRVHLSSGQYTHRTTQTNGIKSLFSSFSSLW